MRKLGKNSASPLSEVTMVVPTVAGREQYLADCLNSIRAQPQSEKLKLVVSGNGTGAESEKIAVSFRACFWHHPEKIVVPDHLRSIVRRVNTRLVWIVGDDDLVAPGALWHLEQELSDHRDSPEGLHAVIGRARFFSNTEPLDLGAIRPSDSEWLSGLFHSLADVSDATLGEVHFGTFVVDVSLIELPRWEKYRGTSHEIFGALWDGIADTEDLNVAVSSAPLVFLRQAEKAWDVSNVRTILGLRRFESLIPYAVGQHRFAALKPLKAEKLLRWAAQSLPAERRELRLLIASYPANPAWYSLVPLLSRRAARLLHFAVQARRLVPQLRLATKWARRR